MFNDQKLISTHSQISSSIKDKSSILTSNNSTLLLGNDEPSLLKLKLLTQNSLIKEYDFWIKLLLDVINDNDNNKMYSDTGTPIQKGLEKIAKLEQENFKIKETIVNQINKNNELKDKIKDKINEINMINDCNNKKSINNYPNLINEKKQLINNIQSFANELDEQSEKNNKFMDIINNDNNNNYLNYKKLLDEYDKVNNENLKLRKIIEIQNYKNKINQEIFKNQNNYININYNKSKNKNSNSKNTNRYNSNFNNFNSSNKKYNVSGLHLNKNKIGNFKLESDDEINMESSLFCSVKK